MAPGLGSVANGPHHAFTLAVDDRGARKDEVGLVRQPGFGGQRVGVLMNGHQFARQCRFVHLEAAGAEQPQVGQAAVPGLQQHDIARHEFLGSPPLFAALAAHSGLGDDHFGERVDGPFGLGLLQVTDRSVDENHPEVGARGSSLSGCARRDPYRLP
jgi:hypothetical protein